jgi:hypothetical protein
MSIANYAELQTAVADWLHRADLTARIPDFIMLGESRLNRELRLFSMENADTISTSTSDRFADLPAGVLEVIDLALYSNNYPQVLTQVPLSEINGNATDVAAMPTFYAISSNIVFNVKSDQVYSCVLRYYKKLDIATDSTNAVLTNYPDLYLYSALLAASPYIKNDARLNTWSTLLKDGVKSANRLDARSRGKAMLTTEAGLFGRARGDIYTDAP